MCFEIVLIFKVLEPESEPDSMESVLFGEVELESKSKQAGFEKLLPESTNFQHPCMRVIVV